MNSLSFLFVALTLNTAAAETQPSPFDSVIRRGASYLRQQAPKETRRGYLAIATLALVNSGDPKDDPSIRQLVARIANAVVNGSFQASEQKYGNYEAAVVLMALAAVDDEKFSAHIQAVTNHLIARQNANGSWDYPERSNGDTSQTQYAVLALWEAACSGMTVPPKVWDKALGWLILHQSTSGAFTYHPAAPDGVVPMVQEKVGHSMSAAGVASMLICRGQLPLIDPLRPRKGRALLTPVPVNDGSTYKPIVTSDQASKAIEAGNRWMAANMTIAAIKAPHTTYNFLHYYIYGLERYAAFGELKTIGGVNWFRDGGEYLSRTQAVDGSWKSFDDMADTAFALLFLGRATQKKIKLQPKVEVVGTGTQDSGRGMPPGEAESAQDARRKDRFKRQLDVPPKQLLDALADPDVSDVELRQVGAALETVDSAALIKAVAGDLSRLRRLTRSDRPGVRRGAIWALARTKDYRVVPVLIESLEDPAFLVYQAARDALCYLSRRMDGFGLPAEKQPNPQQLADATKKWKDWFASLKVQVDPEQEFDD